MPDIAAFGRFMNNTEPIYSDANKAQEHLEALRWPHGPAFPRCGLDGFMKMAGKSTRVGVYKFNNCAKPLSVTVGTIMEDSKIALNKGLLEFCLIASAMKGFSAHEVYRSLCTTYKSVWFMAHRLREATNMEVEGALGVRNEVFEAD
jgi:hypothetical protein